MKENWRLVKQYFIGNIGIELLELDEDMEAKRFIGLTKYEKTKNVVFPLEDADEIIDAIKRIVEDE